MKELKLISKIRSINESLPGLLAGIVGFGIFCEVLGILLLKDRMYFSIGLWIGVLTAVMMSFHMARTLNIATEFSQKDASNYATKQNLLRYFLVVIILGILMLTNVGNPLAAFAGIMGIKVSAYLQPVWTKLLLKISSKEKTNKYQLKK